MPPQVETIQASPDGGVINLADAFKKLDVDGSGSISREELRSHLAKKGRALSEEDFEALFATIDEDGSGCISFSEYSRFMEAFQAKQGRRASASRRGSIRSSLKIATLQESLDSCLDLQNLEEKEAEKAEEKKKEGISRTFKLRPGMARSSSVTRFDKLVRLRRRGSNATAIPRSKRNSLSIHDSLHMEPCADGDVLGRDIMVRFWDVEVRNYDVVASDNPCVRDGVAIELGWAYTVAERMHLDTFEEQRQPLRSKNFSREKKLTRLERLKLVKEFGASQKEIDEATKRANILRKKRVKSISMQKQDKEDWEYEQKRNIMKAKLGFRKRKSSMEDTVDAMPHLHLTLLSMMEIEDKQ